MQSKTRGIVPITIGGQEYKLQYNWAAIEAIESNFEKRAGDAIPLMEEMGLRAVRVFLKAGLQAHHPDADINFGELNDPINDVIATIVEACGYAYNGGNVAESPPEDKPTGKKKAPAKRSAKR